MRLRIRQQPIGLVDGISLDTFRPGFEYDVGTELAGALLADGWAEPVPGDAVQSDEREPDAILVLVVDDDRELRQFTVTVLAQGGYDVIEAQDGRDALARLAQHTPDLIVLDLNMPVMDGWEFCAERGRSPDRRLAAIPILLLTGAASSADHRVATGAVALVEKPFDSDVLLAAIRAALTAG